MPPLSAGPVRNAAEDFLLLARSIAAAEAVEWLPAPTPKPREHVSRTLSEHNDPTGTIATDGRRLALRAQADASRLVLADTRAALQRARVELDDELRRYHGETW